MYVHPGLLSYYNINSIVVNIFAPRRCASCMLYPTLVEYILVLSQSNRDLSSATHSEPTDIPFPLLKRPLLAPSPLLPLTLSIGAAKKRNKKRRKPQEKSRGNVYIQQTEERNNRPGTCIIYNTWYVPGMYIPGYIYTYLAGIYVMCIHIYVCMYATCCHSLEISRAVRNTGSVVVLSLHGIPHQCYM